MTEAVHIGSRRELFVDSFLVEELRGASLQLSHPARGDVAFTADAPWEDWTFGALSLVPDGGRVRLFYRAAIPDLKDERVQHIAVAESTDGGRSFTRPELGLIEFAGSTRNNMVWRGGMPGVPPAFLDSNPACAADARYKGLAQEWQKLFAMGSSDGLRWRLLKDGPLDMPGTFDTINTAFWDPRLGAYRSYTRFFDAAAPQKEGVAAQLGTRAIQTSTSPDFIHWTPPVPLEYEDGEASIQMYTNAVSPCPGAEHIYLGFPNRIVENRSRGAGQRWPGVNDALFMASRDGVRWTRYREAWVRPGRDPRCWTQRNNYPVWPLLAASDDEWTVLISEHYMQPDGAPARLRRLAIRPWGFVSVRAGADGGELLTRPFVFRGERLRLNYSTSAAGSLRLELQDEAGRALPGLSAGDMPPLFGDALDEAVAWKGEPSLAPHAGRPVRLKVLLQDADLFAFRFAP